MSFTNASSFSAHSFLNRGPVPSVLRADRFHKRALAQSFESTWDRVKVLGDGDDYGHAGCVNSLHWARDGELLLSAGDDTTVQIWRMDPTDTSQDYPFVCRTVIHTGHRANIFNAQMLPHSSRIATVAGDRQVRVFDVGDDHGASSVGQNTRQEYCPAHANRTHTLLCHEDRVKRIVSEENPDRFLTVSEDGTVRQHDLRTSHTCRSGCPAPLLQVQHELSTLAISALNPWSMVVAGESPEGYLFDRRFTGRNLQAEWGMKADSLTTCVRRFGKRSSTRRSFRREHITGSRMSLENGHELLLSYSADGVYLYSTLDSPETENSSSSSIVPPNAKRRKVVGQDEVISASASSSSSMQASSSEDMDIDALLLESDQDEDQEDEDEDADDDDHLDTSKLLGFDEPRSHHPWVPVIHPRMRYAGARNVDTVKDVNFVGPNDQYVTSGSDDGNFFVWRKSTGKLHGVYEGDSCVVNVIEGHPKRPLVAVSGIDMTVKLFAPVRGDSEFSRMSTVDSIIRKNVQRSNLEIRTIRRLDFVSLLASARASVLNPESGAEDNGSDETSDCVNQ